MSVLAPFKRLILRAVLRNVSPMVIRILAVPDSLLLHEFEWGSRDELGMLLSAGIFDANGRAR
jgi:hypothetical protein